MEPSRASKRTLVRAPSSPTILAFSKPKGARLPTAELVPPPDCRAVVVYRRPSRHRHHHHHHHYPRHHPEPACYVPRNLALPPSPTSSLLQREAGPGADSTALVVSPRWAPAGHRHGAEGSWGRDVDAAEGGVAGKVPGGEACAPEPHGPRHLPEETFPLLFQYMDAATVCTSSSVSRKWRKMASDDKLWVRLCRARWNLAPEAFEPPPNPIKLLYQLQHGSLRAMSLGLCRGGPLLPKTAPVIPTHTAAQLFMNLSIS